MSTTRGKRRLVRLLMKPLLQDTDRKAADATKDNRTLEKLCSRTEKRKLRIHEKERTRKHTWCRIQIKF